LGKSPAAQSQIETASNVWTARLEALRPSEPLHYFELAEEIADVASDAQQRELARHLFALSGALDADHLGRSACLALADLEENLAVKRKLLALASLMTEKGLRTEDWGLSQIDQRQLSPSSLSPQSPALSPQSSAALAVCEALSRYRRGQGPRALSALRKPGATELLQQHERLLPGGLNRFIEDCKLYTGQQKPTLSAADITRMLRFESALLAGGERSWSGELLLTGGEPLIEVDPARLEESLGVDASKPFYRGGRWVER
jgi:hypothetical protein